jgi:hypothetical protein
VFASIWFVPVFLGIVGLGVVGGFLLVRAWPRGVAQTPEERAEMANAPMPPLQKRAWLSLFIGLATGGTITYLLARNGAVAYWENDSFRLTVTGIFIAGLVLYAIVLLSGVAAGKRNGTMDERDRRILSHAPNAQSAAAILILAVWLISLSEHFREQGAIPVVFLYWIFGSVILMNIISQAIGILLGYWMVARHGEG